MIFWGTDENTKFDYSVTNMEQLENGDRYLLIRLWNTVFWHRLLWHGIKSKSVYNNDLRPVMNADSWATVILSLISHSLHLSPLPTNRILCSLIALFGLCVSDPQLCDDLSLSTYFIRWNSFSELYFRIDSFYRLARVEREQSEDK